MISTFSFLRRRLAKHILIQMRFAHFNTDCVALENVFTFFFYFLFLSGIGSEIQMIRMCILVNLGRVYTERTINDVKRKDPMEKSKEPTLKLKDHAGFINYFHEIFPCATMSLARSIKRSMLKTP